MPLAGKYRSKLREAIMASFDVAGLDTVLRDNDFPLNNIAIGPDFATRVNSLIDNADREGWLLRLCTILAAERIGNEAVHPVFIEVTEILMPPAVDKPDPRLLRIVLSSVETESGWKENFSTKARFFEALEPCDYVDTLERLKQSKENAKSILREIEGTKLFVAFLSKRYIRFPQTAAEFDCALAQLKPGPDGQPPDRRVLALTLDQESRDFIARRIQDIREESCRQCLVVEDFWDGRNRKSIWINGAADDAVVGQILGAAEALRAHFDHEEDSPAPPVLPSALGLLTIPGNITVPQTLQEPGGAPPPSNERIPAVAITPGSVVVLGEPKVTSAPAAVLAADELVRELGGRGVNPERWPDGWRSTNQTVGALSKRPVFVRAIVDKSQTSTLDAASRLSAELNVAFGFQFDEESDAARPLQNCPRVLWRPNGPDWAPAATGPSLYTSTEQPSEFARWLAKLLRADTATGSAIVHYEDPSAKGDIDNSLRRTVIEDCLMSAMTNEQPPLHPDSAPFGYDQLVDVINSVGEEAVTVIAAHDLRTPPGSREATIERFREIDRRIDQTLANRQIKDAPLMRVAVLLRNASLFPALEFSRNSRVRSWQLLRIFKNADGTYQPDAANVERLREYATDLARRRPEQALP
jgi:hypothetical protein